jgi:hypothetical protein
MTVGGCVFGSQVAQHWPDGIVEMVPSAQMVPGMIMQFIPFPVAGSQFGGSIPQSGLVVESHILQ